MSEIRIQAVDLTVGYRKTPVVQGIHFSVRPGEILTLIGPNGAGKSTLLKTLAGYLRPLGGAAFACGQNLEKLPDRQRAKIMAVVLTEPVPPAMMTCREVVETGRYPYTGWFGVLKSRDNQCVDRAIAAVEMGAFAGSPFRAVSDGQRQRVMLARAICQEPEILLLDEPTSFLDLHHKIVFFEILRRLASEQNIAVILSMHELDFAKQISDQVLCICGGAVVRAGPPAEIFTRETLRELYEIPEALYQKYLE